MKYREWWTEGEAWNCTWRGRTVRDDVWCPKVGLWNVVKNKVTGEKEVEEPGKRTPKNFKITRNHGRLLERQKGDKIREWWGLLRTVTGGNDVFSQCVDFKIGGFVCVCGEQKGKSVEKLRLRARRITYLIARLSGWENTQHLRRLQRNPCSYVGGGVWGGGGTTFSKTEE